MINMTAMIDDDDDMVHCVYLCFVLLSELEHFVLLSQYYQHLGSWSALKDFHKKQIQLQLKSAGEMMIEIMLKRTPTNLITLIKKE